MLNGLDDVQRDKETADQMSLITRLPVTPELQSSEMDKSEVIISPALDISNQTLGGKKPLETSNLSETSESSDIGQSIDLDSREAERKKMMGQSDHPTTILEKLFGSALSLESAVSSSHTEVMSSSYCVSVLYLHWRIFVRIAYLGPDNKFNHS